MWISVNLKGKCTSMRVNMKIEALTNLALMGVRSRFLSEVKLRKFKSLLVCSDYKMLFQMQRSTLEIIKQSLN